MISAREAYDELCGYTLTHGDRSFIHQYVVDAFVVQNASAGTKPIGLTFGLIGLYLKIEKQFSGREVQLAHMKIAKNKEVWPAFHAPADRGSMTAIDVIAAAHGPERDKAIDAWCESVWRPWEPDNGHIIADLLRRHAIIPAK